MTTSLLNWLHLVAAATLIGGLMFLHLVLRPFLQKDKSGISNYEMLRKVGQRFRTVTWVCLITLILTGAVRLLHESGSARIETEWGIVLMVKLLVFAFMMGLIIIHDFILDPYKAGGSPSTKSSTIGVYSGKILWTQRGILGLSIGILFIASYLNTI